MQRFASLRTVRIIALIALIAPLSQCRSGPEQTLNRARGSEWKEAATLGASELAQLGYRAQYEPSDREQYEEIEENPFIAVSASPRSTFSIDVDRASYCERAALPHGRDSACPGTRCASRSWSTTSRTTTPSPTATRRSRSAARSVSAPWRPQHRLVRIGLQARRIDAGRRSRRATSSS